MFLKLNLSIQNKLSHINIGKEMRKSEKFESQKYSFKEVNDSQVNQYHYGSDQNINGSGRKSFSQNQKNMEKDRLNSIIAKTFEDLNNDKIQVSIQESQYENERKRANYDQVYPRDIYDNKQQFHDSMFGLNQDYSYSIVNSSNKSSFERRKEVSPNRVAGKLTNSDESMGKYGAIKSNNEDHYYNFTLKNSTLNSQHLFISSQYDSSIPVHEPSYASNKNYQPFNSNGNYPRENSTSNRSGFIKQNKLNSRIKMKLQQQGIQRPISQQEEFQIQFNSRENQAHWKYNNSRQYEEDRNKILDDDFWRKLDQHKSGTQSLKHTFETSKTNVYPINSQSHNDFSLKTKDRTNYSEFGKDKIFEDSVCLSQKNPFHKQYQADLFDFIKKELINTTVENKQVTDKEFKVVTEFNAQKEKNLNLYHLYQKTKHQFATLVNSQRYQIEALQNDIKLLEGQRIFYKEHSMSIQKSISVKMKKQDDFDFKHKANLQEIILSNNKKIIELKNELFIIENLKNSASNLSNPSKIEEITRKSNYLNASLLENERLKLELKQQQLLYDKALNKLIENNLAIHELQRKKAVQIKALVEQFQNAKRFIPFQK